MKDRSIFLYPPPSLSRFSCSYFIIFYRQHLPHTTQFNQSPKGQEISLFSASIFCYVCIAIIQYGHSYLLNIKEYPLYNCYNQLYLCVHYTCLFAYLFVCGNERSSSFYSCWLTLQLQFQFQKYIFVGLYNSSHIKWHKNSL